MGMDIRLPMGLMFALFGVILAIYGIITQFSNSDLYKRSLGVNVNLWWGLVMLAFGAVMLLLTWRAAKNPAPEPPRSDNAEPPRQPGH